MTGVRLAAMLLALSAAPAYAQQANPADGLGRATARPAIMSGVAFARENGVSVDPVRNRRPRPLPISRCAGDYLLIDDEHITDSFVFRIRRGEGGSMRYERELVGRQPTAAVQRRSSGAVPHLLLQAEDGTGPAVSCYDRYLVFDTPGLDHEEGNRLVTEILIRSDRSLGDVLRQRGFELGVMWSLEACSSNGSCREAGQEHRRTECERARAEHLRHNPGTATCRRITVR
jgi:hypothetical protein